MELEEIVRAFEASLSHNKWRLRSSSKRRLQTDILALCTGLRPVIMVDYGGKLPELADRLSAFLNHCKKESSTFELLRVMVIDDMIYLIHVRALADFVASSLKLENEMLFVDLESDPAKMITTAEKIPVVMQLISAQQLFSTVFPACGEINGDLQRDGTQDASSSFEGHISPESSEIVDLTFCLQKSQVTIPTLNGWLLGYPVIYLIGIDNIDRAVYSLSTKSLHIYQIFVNRVGVSKKGDAGEELMSFTVPYELSLEGVNEPWAKSFLAHMQEKWGKCKQVWGSLHMEVSSCDSQAIAL